MKKIEIYLFVFLFGFISYGYIYPQIPYTIPALKQWKPENGLFVFNSSNRIAVDKMFEVQLISIAQTFKEDVFAMNGRNLQIQITDQAYPNDIFLTMKSVDTTIGEEGYSIDVSDRITINAKTRIGVFYGTRTILQLMKQNDSLNCGEAIDFPDYKERGLSVDFRKYFSSDWIKNHVKELSYMKMNLFHLHLSDNEAFRLECASYPKIISKEFLKKSEIKEILNLADKYFVNIIPEIDMPNHMSAILEYFPELWLYDTLKNTSGSCCLDINLPHARAFVKDILEEYLDLFSSSKYWDLGTDEYPADFKRYPQFINYAKSKYGLDAFGKDALFDFVNWVDSIVVAHGKTLRIWNDFLNKSNGIDHKTNLNKDIIIDFWNSDIHPQQLLDSGYKINNSCLYYIIGDGAWVINYIIYNTHPEILYNNQTVQAKHPYFLGGQFLVWCDRSNLETQNQIALDLYLTTRTFGQLFWNSKSIDSNFSYFNVHAKKLGRAPGVIFPSDPLPNDLALFKKIVFSSVYTSNPEFLPENSIDGDLSTYCSTQYLDSQWVYIDFGKTESFTRVRLKWHWSYSTDYLIQTSDDTTNWKTIYTVNNGNGEFDDFDTLNGKGRYLRFYFIKKTLWFGCALYEIEVYDSTRIKGISDIEEELPFKIGFYPNPANSLFNIDLNPETDCHIKVYIIDIKGNIVENLIDQRINTGLQRLSCNVKTWSAGEYLCCFEIDKRKFTKKLILIR
ncbi:MAG: family 20 glycosylhydrolase [Candidatus Kapabacteria bacterium]|nr:family 20 glycosylhydrolase [Candidatus Kapabacteria bacterium]